MAARAHRDVPRRFDREAAGGPAPDDPARDAELADSVGLALRVVLDTLEPAERLAFVLHDVFAVSFGEIAPGVDRSPVARPSGPYVRTSNYG